MMSEITENYTVNGLHHVTAIASSAQANLDFWTKRMGLRLVKKTVNFDDPGTYHLYYGNEIGSPGTALTYFPWQHMPQRRAGTGEVSHVHYSVPEGSLDFWKKHLNDQQKIAEHTLFGCHHLVLKDPDGGGVTLVEREDSRKPWTGSPIRQDKAIRGFDGVTLHLQDKAATQELLTGLMHYEIAEQDGAYTRLLAKGTNGAASIILHEDKEAPISSQGTGSVHHVAFSTPDKQTQQTMQALLKENGFAVTQQINRQYFTAIYFQSPEGVLFEIATEQPGFTIDEPVEALGSSLVLPPEHESKRAAIEKNLPVLEHA
jgi:glyoxalase family protein